MKKRFFYLIIFFTLLILFLCGIYKNFSANENTLKQNEIIENAIIKNEVQEVILEKEDIHINMSVIGDIMCHNTQYMDAFDATSNTYDFSYVFTDIKQYIEPADIAIGNLETTFAGKEKGYSNFPKFNTPEQLATNLKDLGIDVLSTANNHSMDTNYTGLVSTIHYLNEVGISHVGTNITEENQNKILIKDVNGITIAFLAFTYGTNGIPLPDDKNFCVNLIDEELILEQIHLARQKEPDLICVSMHWGTEYQQTPNAEQEDLANLLFKNGVDIILGNHPHVLQPMEKKEITLEDGTTKNGFIIYSFGNFMSGQTKTNTRNSVILNIEIMKDGETAKTTLRKVKYIPIYMHKSSTARTKRYKILDIEKSIFSYESEIDQSIGESIYLNLKNEFSHIKMTLGDYIQF